MNDLRIALESVLGTAYRIERELGGGGMSHVYLAEETALGRRMVIKVLPPDTAASVNADRFRREIQMAAQLQHPAIVPLLRAGASNELMWYAMPFVDGASLRAKLARTGQLPLEEAVRAWRDLLEALEYVYLASSSVALSNAAHARLLAQAYRRLGELYEDAGNTKLALQRYSDFVTLWKNADASLQPAVKAAKERMARLQARKN